MLLAEVAFGAGGGCQGSAGPTLGSGCDFVDWSCVPISVGWECWWTALGAREIWDWARMLKGELARLAGGGQAGGGEDGFEFAGAYDGVDFGDVLLDFVAVALDEAAGDDDALGFAAVLLLVLDHLEDGVDGLLLGGVDEAAGVDDDDLGVFGVGGELGAVVVEDAHHDLGVDEVFGAAEGDEAYFGAGGRGVGGGRFFEDGGGSHRLLF